VSLPGVKIVASAVITKNRVYLLGGNNGSAYVSTVYTAPINADGTLGTWTTGTSLPVELSSSQVIMTKNCIYLLGGHTLSSTAISTVYTATISGGLNDY
jgi:N-acetylneuraminic acid mutarotase